MSTTGAKAPTVASSTSETGWAGNAWLTPENLYGAGDAAITAATFDAGVHSRVLRAYGFDFSAIPDNATITGVKVIIGGAYYATAICALGLAQLLDTAGARVGTNQYTTNANLTTSPASYTKGGDGDNWGNALTPAWVKNSNFGVGIGIIVGASNNCDVFIGSITTEIFYTAPEAHSGAGTMSHRSTTTPTGNKQGKGVGAVSAVVGLVAVGLAAMAGVATASLPTGAVGVGLKAAPGSGSVSHAVTMAATGVLAYPEVHSGAGSMSVAHAVAATGKVGAQGAGSDSETHHAIASGGKGALGPGSASAVVTMSATGSTATTEEHFGSGALSMPVSLPVAGMKGATGVASLAPAVVVVAAGVPYVEYVSDVWVALPPTKNTIVGSPSCPRRRKIGESMWWRR